MLERATSNTPLAKAIRLVLVFSLVFWMSFRVECLAFALTFDDGSGHDGDVLTNLAVYTVVNGELGSTPIRDAADTKVDNQQVQDVNVSSNGGTVQFAASPTWEQGQGQDDPQDPENPNPENPDPQDPENPEGPENPDPGTSGDPTTTGDPEESSVEEPVDESGEETPPVEGIVAPQAEGDGAAAAYVKWEIVNGSEYADIASNDDGTVTLTGKGTAELVEADKASEKVTLKCSLDTGKLTPTVGDSIDSDAAIEFDVTVMTPYVGAIDIMKQGSEETCGSDTLELEEAERESYQFWAQVQINDDVNTDSQRHDVTPGNGLGKVMKGAFGELKWEVLDENGEKAVEESVATITEEGALTLKGDGPVIVKCSNGHGKNGELISAQVKVAAKGSQQQEDDPAARQGKSNPQSELTVVIEQPKTQAQGEGESEDGQASGGAANPSGESSEGGQESAGEGEAAEPSGESSGSSESASSEEAAQDITKTFDVEGLKAFEGDFGQEDYTLTIDGKEVKVTGRGVTIPRLLQESGLPQKSDDAAALTQEQIESIDFVNADGETRNVAWSDLVSISAQCYPMIAVEAYVHPDAAQAGDNSGEQSSEAQEGESSEQGSETSQASEEPRSSEASSSSGPTFYDNARFQLLYTGGTGTLADGGSLRWINKIVVHTKAKEQQEGPVLDKYLRVKISYAPVAKDHSATLTALPDSNIEGLSYGLAWERSIDGGKTWDVYNDESVQSISVMTDDEHIGNQFRVILEANAKDEETGENRKAMSDPAEITVANKTVVVVDYIPPIAGTIAEFATHFEKVDADPIDEARATYSWELSYDDGATWSPFTPPETGQTLRIPTTPIDEDASSSDSSEAKLMLIRVTAVVPNHDPLVSEPVPFTVRTGDSTNTSKKADEIADQLNNNNNNNNNSSNNSNNDATGDPVDDNTDYPDEYPDDVETDDLVETDDPDAQSDTAQEADEQPAQVTVTEIPSPEVNREVSKQAQKQKQAQKPDPSTPGAKWTEISARPSSEDIQNALADNPFAPFAIPMGLGITVAGGLEKLLAFRRQL